MATWLFAPTYFFAADILVIADTLVNQTTSGQMLVHMRECVFRSCVLACTCLLACLPVSLYDHVRVRVRVRVYACVHVCMPVFTPACLRACEPTCMRYLAERTTSHAFALSTTIRNQKCPTILAPTRTPALEDCGREPFSRPATQRICS